MPRFPGGPGEGLHLRRANARAVTSFDRIEAARAEISEIKDSEDYLMLSEATTKGLKIYIADLEATLDAEIAQLNEELMSFSTGV